MEAEIRRKSNTSFEMTLDNCKYAKDQYENGKSVDSVRSDTKYIWLTSDVEELNLKRTTELHSIWLGAKVGTLVINSPLFGQEFNYY